MSIDLEEPGYPGNDSDEVKNIIPNQEVVKDPQVENSGVNDALVFLRVEVPQETYTDEDDGTWEQKKQDLFKLKGISDQWELLRTETITNTDGKEKTSYVYGYKKKLEKKSATDKLFQKVQMRNAMEADLNGKVEDIIVTACAIQADNIPDIDLTPGSDGTLDKDVLDEVYEIFLNQSGDEKARPADEGNKPQDGSIGKITYELNGGTITGAKKSYTAADYGYVPPVPTKEGYKFTGWIPETLPTDSAGDIAFTALWTEDSATLLNGETLNAKMTALTGKRTLITAIQHSDSEPSETIKVDANSLVSNSENPVYMWFEDGVIKWWSPSNKVKTGQSLNQLCFGMTNLTDISGLADWDTTDTVTMWETFMACSNLENLEALSNWNMEHVTDIALMFFTDQRLKSLSGLENWNTSSLIDMSGTFGACSTLANIDALKDWDVRNVLYMGIDQQHSLTRYSGAFTACTSLTNLSALKNWDVRNVIDMQRMFTSCENLIDASAINDWNIMKVTNFNLMFQNCPTHPEFTKRAGTWEDDMASLNTGTFVPAT